MLSPVASFFSYSIFDSFSRRSVSILRVYPTLNSPFFDLFCLLFTFVLRTGKLLVKSVPFNTPSDRFNICQEVSRSLHNRFEKCVTHFRVWVFVTVCGEDP